MKISAKILKKKIIQIFKKYNLKSSHAKISAEVLVKAELVGSQSHGISRLKMYCDRIKRNLINSKPKIVIKKISKLLKINIDTLNDLAGISKGNVAPDIGEYIENNPGIVSLIRSIKENNLNDEQIEKIENSLNKNYNKALIIAAGLGSRLKKHTENLPKCMLDFGGKTLLQRQLDSYKKC